MKNKEPIAYRYLDILSMLFVTAFLTATILSHRMFLMFGIELAGGIFAFPFTFFLGDVITEVYGAKRCNRIIYLSLVCQVLFLFMCQFILNQPSPANWDDQYAYEVVLGFLPRYCLATVTACLFAYWINNYILIKIRSLTNGRYLWLRTIGATTIGEAMYTVIIITIGYHDISAYEQVSLIVYIYIFKVLYEVVATPFTYLTVNFLKRNEKINILGKYKNINPYTLELDE